MPAEKGVANRENSDRDEGRDKGKLTWLALAIVSLQGPTYYRESRTRYEQDLFFCYTTPDLETWKKKVNISEIPCSLPGQKRAHHGKSVLTLRHFTRVSNTTILARCQPVSWLNCKQEREETNPSSMAWLRARTIT